MGQRIIRYDDLDETQDDTVAPREFSVGRNGWEMDLTDENYARLLDVLAPFIEKAKKVRGPGIKARDVAPPEDPGTAAPQAQRFTSREEQVQLAQWAERNDVKVPRRGRPPRDVLAAFRADDVSLVPERYRAVNA